MQTKQNMTVIGSRRTNVAILGALLVAAAIAASLLIWQRSAPLLPVQLSMEVRQARPALDQHERHPAGLPTDLSAPLDQHERHPDLFGAAQSRGQAARIVYFV